MYFCYKQTEPAGVRVYSKRFSLFVLNHFLLSLKILKNKRLKPTPLPCRNAPPPSYIAPVIRRQTF